MTSNQTILLQLPVPQLVPAHTTGNLPLAAASLLLACQNANIPPALHPTLFDQQLQSHAGDALLLSKIAAMQPQRLGFSCAVWNIERVVMLSRKIKQLLPQTEIIVGGPEITTDSWIWDEPQLPFGWGFEGEGELPFIQALKDGFSSSIDGIITASSRMGSQQARLQHSLGAIHDPFLSGLVQPEADGVMFVEFYRGCRYHCSYCRYHQGRLRSDAALRPRDQISEVFAWARAHGIKEIYLLDPSLEQRNDFESFIAFIQHENSSRIPLFCELRLDKIDPSMAQALRKAGVAAIETGLQTINPDALAGVGRSLDCARFLATARALADQGITIKTDIMLGLPHDSPATMAQTIEFCIDNNLHENLQLFRTQVLPGTRLKAQAQKLGIVYENRPPYFVLSTPQWPENRLEECLADAEDTLGLSLAAEDRPLLVATEWLEKGWTQNQIPNTPAIFFYGFNLETTSGREMLSGQRFEQAAAATTLWFSTHHPLRDITPILEAQRTMVQANPFSALCTVVSLPPGAPLDILSALERDRSPLPTHYVNRMHTQQEHPGRRLFIVVDEGVVQNHASWLDAAAVFAEVVVLRRLASLAQANRERLYLPDWADYLFVDTPAAEGERLSDGVVKQLAELANEPQQLLLPAPQLHWQWLEAIEQRPAKQ